MNSCYICNSTKFLKVDGIVRDLPNLNILKCNNCGLITLESFDHIDDTYYEFGGMREEDEYIQDLSNVQLDEDDKKRFNDLKDRIKDKDILDFGAGEGGFLSMCKEVANNVVGLEIDDRARKTIVNHYNIICYKQLKDIPVTTKFDFITLFHVIEHLKDPIDVIKKLSKHLNPNGKIILEFPNADDALLSLYKSDEFSKFTYWSCHLMLYNEDNIKKLLKKASLNCITKQIQRYPLSNHLYWLSNNKPGGHIIWNFLDTKILNKEYEKVLGANGSCDTLWVEASI